MRYKYQLDNLYCANCAGKIEAKIAETDGFEDVSFNFATKLHNFKSEKQNPVSEIQAICDSIEDGVTVFDKTPKTNLKKYTYILDNLNCAHCAGKIEAKIAETAVTPSSVRWRISDTTASKIEIARKIVSWLIFFFVISGSAFVVISFFGVLSTTVTPSSMLSQIA